jgi:hypothetical protein
MDDLEARIEALEQKNDQRALQEAQHRIQSLEENHNKNRQKIQENQQGVRASLAVLVFSAIVFGLPVASVKWSGDDRKFEFTRDTVSPHLVIIGGLVAAALFAGDKPIDLLRSILNKK